MARRKSPVVTNQLLSLSAAADYLRVRVGWVRAKIDDGTLKVVSSDGAPMLESAAIRTIAQSDEYWAFKDDERVRSLQSPYIPDHLRDYHRFHKTLNDFTWLLKAYFTPRPLLKQGHFRLDHLLQHYLREVPTIEKIGKAFAGKGALSTTQARTASESLKKVWYNELAFASPALGVPLMLDKRGVGMNLGSSADRLAFPSWRITQAYYVSYHAGRALADLCGLSYRPEEHHAPMRAFKNSGFGPAARTVLRFPFNLALRSQKARFADLRILEGKPHLKFQYASHPRPPNHSFSETGQSVLDALHDARRERWSAASAGEPFLLTDFLYQFRVWANYVDVENIVALKSGGFRAYLDLDLHTINFFLSAVVELVALARLGASRVILLAEEFHHDFVKGDEKLWNSTGLHPLNVRLRIYEHAGRLDGLRWRPALPPPDIEVELLHLPQRSSRKPS